VLHASFGFVVGWEKGIGFLLSVSRRGYKVILARPLRSLASTSDFSAREGAIADRAETIRMAAGPGGRAWSQGPGAQFRVLPGTTSKPKFGCGKSKGARQFSVLPRTYSLVVFARLGTGSASSSGLAGRSAWRVPAGPSVAELVRHRDSARSSGGRLSGSFGVRASGDRRAEKVRVSPAPCLWEFPALVQ